MTVAICPGSFDPITLGHVDVVERASVLFERVVVACLRNAGKSPMFEVDARIEMLREVVGHLPGVEVGAFDGLLVDVCHDVGATVIVKGVRGGGDIEHEMPMAHMNAHVGDVETVLLPARPHWAFVSSSLVKEVARLGGDVDDLVPPAVARALAARLALS